MKKIIMIDMEMGNLKSVISGFKRVGASLEVASGVEDIKTADAIVLPGVGAFGDAMAALAEKDLIQAIIRHARGDKKPLLGICVGMQLLSDKSEEYGEHRGLGLIAGEVKLLKPTIKGYRVPHIGWSDVGVKKRDGIFSSFGEAETCYFAHSYYVACADPADIAAEIEFSGQRIPCAIERENIVGVQFHPEKSQSAGLDFLAAFVKS